MDTAPGTSRGKRRKRVILLHGIIEDKDQMSEQEGDVSHASYEQTVKKLVHVYWVIDDSGSMRSYQVLS